jgi:hypothetical protein
VIQRPSDILDLFGRGIQRLIIAQHQLSADFFDLSSGFAGELVQKCVNYGMRVAVVGAGYEDRSMSFRDFVTEINRGGRFVFVGSVAEGFARLRDPQSASRSSSDASSQRGQGE